jgi:hypothetical protein
MRGSGTDSEGFAARQCTGECWRIEQRRLITFKHTTTEIWFTLMSFSTCPKRYCSTSSLVKTRQRKFPFRQQQTLRLLMFSLDVACAVLIIALRKSQTDAAISPGFAALEIRSNAKDAVPTLTRWRHSVESGLAPRSCDVKILTFDRRGTRAEDVCQKTRANRSTSPNTSENVPTIPALKG